MKKARQPPNGLYILTHRAVKFPLHSVRMRAKELERHKAFCVVVWRMTRMDRVAGEIGLGRVNLSHPWEK